MPSVVSLISVIVLMLFSFLAGVKYCNKIKDQSSWMFETSEELALPNYRDSYRDMRMGDEADIVQDELEADKSESKPTEVKKEDAQKANTKESKGKN